MGWVPVHYFFRSVPPDELLALYRAADIALITPLKDGMNLVAKEFCACNLEEESVLILSQFAGAAAQLGRWALVVNPYDVEQTADAIYNAFRMPAGERRYRMKQMRRNVRTQNVFWWVDSVHAGRHQQGVARLPRARGIHPRASRAPVPQRDLAASLASGVEATPGPAP